MEIELSGTELTTLRMILRDVTQGGIDYQGQLWKQVKALNESIEKQLKPEIERRNEEKYQEVVDLAVQHTTGKGLQRGIFWLKKAFNEYFDWHESKVEEGKLWTFGGQAHSEHNRSVLAGRLAITVRDDYEISQSQYEELRDTLEEIAENRTQGRGWHR